MNKNVEKIDIKKLSRYQKGIGLLETMLALAVSLFLAAVAFPMYQKSSDAAKVDKTVSEISQVQQAVSRMYQSASDVSAISNAVLSTANAWPSTMVSSGIGTAGAVIRNAYGGTVTVLPSSSVSAPLNNINYYMITEGSVPQQACVDIVNAVSPSFYQVDVNGVTVKSVTAAVAAPSVVSTNCATSLSSNTIVLHGKP
jgi:type II secretory pathway pseudopilin PulG